MGRHDDNPWQDATRIRLSPRLPEDLLPDDLLAGGLLPDGILSGLRERGFRPGFPPPGFSDIDRPLEDAALRRPAVPPVAPAAEAAGLMERLVYVSRAARGLDAGQIYAIIRHAHAGNGPAGVTGALLFLDGWFVQALEGPARTLDAWIGRIRHDPRHAGLQVRSRERAHARLFAGQPMALRTRACIDAGLLEAFDYRPGFPVGAFPADVLVEFLVQACRRRRVV